MTFEEKYDFAIKELENAKIWKSNYNPPLIRLLHKMGFKVPFPYYDTFTNNALRMGIFFGTFWGLLMFITTWQQQKTPLIIVLLGSLVAGALFGILMAGYYKCRLISHFEYPFSTVTKGTAKALTKPVLAS